jgi:lambda family phage portal protein
LDLVRNNPHAARGVEAIVSNVFGAGIVPRFKRGRETATELDELARETLDSTSIDVTGRLDVYGLQALMGQTVVQSGEALVRRIWTRDSKFPVQFQLLEPDHIDSSRDTLRAEGGGRIIQGVEFDRLGRRVRYWLYPDHPGGRMSSAQSVPVKAADVAHVYRMERPGQVRGIPWLAPVMLRMADFSDYEEAQLLRQKIAACFVGFKSDPIDSVAPAQQPASDDLEEMEPGLIYRTGSGSTVTFAQPHPITDYKDYSRVSLRAIAAGLGISHEALTGDLEGVNFTSGRMGRLEMERNISRWRWHTFIPQGCDVMVRWWLEGAALLGHDVDGVTVKHTAPPREMISPEREVPSRTAMMRSGQTSLAEIAAERGLDLEELLDEIKEGLDMLDARGIVLDSDPRRTSAAGLTQARAGETLTLPPLGPPDDGEGNDDD